jgi:hypothetical protein
MSFTGLKTINATDINNQGEIRLTSDLEAGTSGQVIISQGEGQPAIWGSNSTALPNALTMGSDVFLTSGNSSFDGSIPDTINAAGHGFGSGGNGIDITGNIITTDNDGITISNSTGVNKVLKTPGTLTINQNTTLVDTFDGSINKTINLEGKYSAGDGIEISGHTIPVIEADTDENTISKNVGGAEQLQVLKVPNDLTFTGYATGTFNGSSALNINLVDTDTTYQGGTGISINTATNPDTINCFNIPNSALQNSTISGKALGSNLSTITFYSNTGSFLTSYNGADPPTSVTLDGDTTYQGGQNISIDTTTNPDTINLDSAPTNLDLSSSTNTFPLFVGGSEILKSMSYIDNVSQNFNRIFNTSNEYFFSGSQDSGSDTLEIDFTATSTTGYCEYGFYANTLTPGLVFCVGIAAATAGTSPFSTTLTSSPVSIDAYKIGLFDGTTTTYSLKEILDFTSYENTYITSKFFFNNLNVGTRYRMALYGRCYSSGSIYINAGGKNTTGFASRSFHQPAFMKFYEYDSSIGGARTTSSGGGK